PPQAPRRAGPVRHRHPGTRGDRGRPVRPLPEGAGEAWDGRMDDSHIVVGVDGSPASETALGWAVDEAHRHGRALYLVHALAWPGYAAASGLPPDAWAGDERRQRAEDLIRGAAERAHAQAPDVRVHGEVVPGTPAAALVNASEQAAMVVLGRRGSGGGLGGLVVGSIST